MRRGGGTSDGEAREWWQDETTLRRVLSDLVTDEVGRLRPGASLPPKPWAMRLALGDEGLACDSIERLALASAVVEAFGLPGRDLQGARAVLRAKTLAGLQAAVRDGLRTAEPTLTFRTSGSTGEPRPCRHALSDLDQEAAELGRLFRGRRRLLSAVAAHHIYGFLFTVLLPRHLNCDLVDIRDTSPECLAAMMREGDLIVGHPTFWSAAARGNRRFSGDVVGVTSTAPCPPSLADALADRGLARLVQVYGSSETAGVGWRDDPDGPYALFPFWGRGDDPLELVRRHADGASTFEVPDQLDWIGRRYFYVRGRRDDAVQVAGRNVFPSRVRQHLCAHPAVADASVRLMRPDEGQRLKAFIVPKMPSTDLQVLRNDIDAWCQIGLLAAERPKSFLFGMHLPVTECGKAADWLIEKAAP